MSFSKKGIKVDVLCSSIRDDYFGNWSHWDEEGILRLWCTCFRVHPNDAIVKHRFFSPFGFTVERTQMDSPDVDERGLVAVPLVAEEQLVALKAAVVEVGLLPTVGALHAGEALGNSLSRRLVDDGQVSNGRLRPAGLGLRQVLLQGRGLVRQPGHHKVVGHAVALVLNHGWSCLGREEAGGAGSKVRLEVREWEHVFCLLSK